MKKSDWWYLRKAVIAVLMPHNNMYLARIVKMCGLSRSIVGRVLKELISEGVVKYKPASEMSWWKDERLGNIYWLNKKYPKQRVINMLFPPVGGEVMLAGVRVLPLKTDSPYTCAYYPATDKHAARCVCRVGLSHNVMDEAGYVFVEWTFEQVTFWDSIHDDLGKGMADIACKNFTPGRTISLAAAVQVYDGAVFCNGNFIQNEKGDVKLTTKRRGLVCEPGSIVLGVDSIKFLDGGYGEDLAIPKWYTPGDKTYGYAEVRNIQPEVEVEQGQGGPK